MERAGSGSECPQCADPVDLFLRLRLEYYKKRKEEGEEEGEQEKEKENQKQNRAKNREDTMSMERGNRKSCTGTQLTKLSFRDNVVVNKPPLNDTVFDAGELDSEFDLLPPDPVPRTEGGFNCTIFCGDAAPPLPPPPTRSTSLFF